MKIRHSTEEDLHIRWMAVDGLTVRTAVRDGHGVPLLLLNGIGGAFEMLLPFVDTLPERRVVLVDVPGAGKSPAPVLPMRFSDHARVCAHVLDRLHITMADVMGVSWGGALAQQFAHQYPERCRNLILAATSPGHLMVPGRPSALLRMSNPRRYYEKDYMKKIAGTIYGGKLRTNRLSAGRFADLTSPPSKRGYYFQILAGVGWSSLPWLHKLAQPTLVMHGDDDPLIPLINARIMARLIPDSTLRVYDCGHLFMLTRAGRVARTVLETCGP